MTDEQTPLPMTNSPEARTETGEIKDQGSIAPVESAPVESAPPEHVAPVIPDRYDFTLPEGSILDPKLLEEVTPIFKELKLDQPSAQRLVDIYQKQTSGTTTALLAQVEKTRTEWRDASKADPDIGPILDSKVLPEIGRALSKLPSEVSTNLRSALDFTGAGDHPAVVRAFYEFSKLVNEGTHVSGNGPSPNGQQPSGKTTPPSLASALYPNLPH